MVRVLRLIGWLSMVAGLIIWLVIWGSQPSITEPNTVDLSGYFGFAFFVSGLVFGVLFLAAAEVIKLLREIRDNTRNS